MSHHASAKPLVREVRECLPRHIDAWIDEHELLVGADLTESLREAIQSQADFLILFLDGRAAQSVWVKTELEWALDEERRIGRPFILPILIDDDLGDDCAWVNDRLYLKCHGYRESDVRFLADELSSALFAWLSRDIERLRAERSGAMAPFLHTLDDAPRSSFPEMTKNATAVDVLSRTSVNLIGNYRGVLSRLVREDARIRFVMVNPLSDVCKHLYGAHLELFQHNLRTTTEHLRELEQSLGFEVHRDTSSLRVKFLSEFPPFSFTRVERNGLSDSAIKVQLNFLYTLTGRDRPVFDLKGGTEWYECFRLEFEEIWKHAEYLALPRLDQAVDQ
jgi:hypothetical protein